MNSEAVQVKRPVMGSWKVRVLGGLGSFGLAGVAMAGNITDGLEPVITDITTLFPLLVTMIIAAVPIMIIMLFIDFLTGMFGGILGKLR